MRIYFYGSIIFPTMRRLQTIFLAPQQGAKLTRYIVKGDERMFKVVKNHGQCKALAGKGKYILQMYDEIEDVNMYAKLGIKPVIGYILAAIKYG